MKIMLYNCGTMKEQFTCSDDDNTQVSYIGIWDLETAGAPRTVRIDFGAVTVQRASAAAANAHVLLQGVSVIQMCAATAGLGKPLCISLVIDFSRICPVFLWQYATDAEYNTLFRSWSVLVVVSLYVQAISGLVHSFKARNVISFLSQGPCASYISN